jgi:hypothetical protein
MDWNGSLLFHPDLLSSSISPIIIIAQGPISVFSQAPQPTQPVEVPVQHSLVLVQVRLSRRSKVLYTNVISYSAAGCDGQWQRPRSNRTRSEFGFPDELGDWKAPFSRQDCDGIREKLGLPRVTATMLDRNCWAYGVSHFQRFRLSVGPGCDKDLAHALPSDDGDGIGMNFYHDHKALWLTGCVPQESR